MSSLSCWGHTVDSLGIPSRLVFHLAVVDHPVGGVHSGFQPEIMRRAPDTASALSSSQMNSATVMLPTFVRPTNIEFIKKIVAEDFHVWDFLLF